MGEKVPYLYERRGVSRDYEHLSQAVRLAKIALESYALPKARFGIVREGRNPLLVRVFSADKGKFLLRLYNPLPKTERETYKLPVHRVQRLSEAGLRSQMLWLSDIRRTMRLSVPEPMPTAEGSLVGRTSAEGVPGSRLFVLLRWIPGVHKERGNRTPSDAHSIGSYIARLHQHAERYSPPKGFVRPRWDWDYLFGESAPQWKFGEAVFSEDEMEMLASAAELVRRKLSAIGQDRTVFGIIHRDLHPDTNIVFHDKVVYAIDFDHCGWGYYLYDLARTYIVLEDEPMRKAILEGYQRERPLPDDYREALETFVVMRLVEMINVQLSKLERIPLGEIPARSTWKSTLLRPRVERLATFLANGTL